MISRLRGSVQSTITIPLRRLDAPSREITQTRPSSETFTSLVVRASTTSESVRSGFAGSVTSHQYVLPWALCVPVIA